MAALFFFVPVFPVVCHPRDIASPPYGGLVTYGYVELGNFFGGLLQDCSLFSMFLFGVLRETNISFGRGVEVWRVIRYRC